MTGKTLNFILTSCVICHEPFFKRREASGHNSRGINLRSARAVTCSKKCSRENSDLNKLVWKQRLVIA